MYTKKHSIGHRAITMRFFAHQSALPFILIRRTTKQSRANIACDWQSKLVKRFLFTQGTFFSVLDLLFFSSQTHKQTFHMSHLHKYNKTQTLLPTNNILFYQQLKLDIVFLLLSSKCLRFSPSFSNIEMSRNLDMQELDYNPSKKDLTDAKIHHLLAEELKPYKRVSHFKQASPKRYTLHLRYHVSELHVFRWFFFQFHFVTG